MLITGPSLQDQGGVANYYNVVYPRLSTETMQACYMEIGSTHGRGRLLHLIGDQVRFWRKVTVFQPDIIHVNPSLVPKSFLRDGLFILSAKLRKKPVLVFFRGWEVPFERLVAGKLGWFFRITYKKADKFIVLATRFADCLRGWGVVAPVHTGTTAVADDMLDDFSIGRKLINLKEAKTIKLLFLARLEQKKGVVELVRAVMELLDRGKPLELTVAGAGPAMAEITRLLPDNSNYRKRIHIVGYVSGKDKFDILSSHHIFCFPTQYAEGMPNSIMEAMAFGMPVITCPVGGMADFFVDGQMGVLLESANINEISGAIENLVSDRDKSVSIARYNHEYALQHFLASTSAEMLRTRYSEMIGEQ